MVSKTEIDKFKVSISFKSHSANIYLFYVNNRKTKVGVKYGYFIVNFNHISYVFLVQVNVSWKCINPFK